MKMIVISAAAGIFVASLAISARADPYWSKDPKVTEKISYADLDLSSAAGQKHLKNRISFAAYRLCLADAPASPSPAVADPNCFRHAMTDGLAQMQRAIAAADIHKVLASESLQRHR